MAGTHTRRQFVKVIAAGAGAMMSAPAVSYARIIGANERVGIGMIGIGQQSRGHLNNLVNAQPGAQVVQLCDVFQPNLEFAGRLAPGVPTAGDFRRVLDNKDVDAVVIGSPDHWHPIQAIRACEAGKDVYVEKPVSVRIAEGRKMVEAARKYNRVMQVGTQQRSQPHFQEVVELVRAGKLGNVSFVRAWNFGNQYPQGIGNPSDSEPIAGLDWEMWLGPAPKRAFNINRFGAVLDKDLKYTRWASFRWFWDYAGGMMTDWGVHLLDIVQWAMNVDYPTSVSAIGGKFNLKDNRETPDTIIASYQYPGFAATYENRETNGLPMEGHGYGIMFHGTAGTLFVDRSGYEIIPEKGSDLQPVKKSATGSSGVHMRNFLECIKSREKPICDIEIGHRSSTTAMLGNVAFRTGRTIHWDGQKELVVDDAEANAMLVPQERGIWKI